MIQALQITHKDTHQIQYHHFCVHSTQYVPVWKVLYICCMNMDTNTGKATILIRDAGIFRQVVAWYRYYTGKNTILLCPCNTGLDNHVTSKWVKLTFFSFSIASNMYVLAGSSALKIQTRNRPCLQIKKMGHAHDSKSVVPPKYWKRELLPWCQCGCVSLFNQEA